eukprot:GHVN01065214.1.p1 GENE.GHVN01065214.1~~GHVN01065214.1.p1  ORF type:complete len:690 (-),score=85.14 GHVN01065214.1:68-2137(-)
MAAKLAEEAQIAREVAEKERLEAEEQERVAAAEAERIKTEQEMERKVAIAQAHIESKRKAEEDQLAKKLAAEEAALKKEEAEAAEQAAQESAAQDEWEMQVAAKKRQDEHEAQRVMDIEKQVEERVRLELEQVRKEVDDHKKPDFSGDDSTLAGSGLPPQYPYPPSRTPINLPPGIQPVRSVVLVKGTPTSSPASPFIPPTASPPTIPSGDGVSRTTALSGPYPNVFNLPSHSRASTPAATSQTNIIASPDPHTQLPSLEQNRETLPTNGWPESKGSKLMVAVAGGQPANMNSQSSRQTPTPPPQAANWYAWQSMSGTSPPATNWDETTPHFSHASPGTSPQLAPLSPQLPTSQISHGVAMQPVYFQPFTFPGDGISSQPPATFHVITGVSPQPAVSRFQEPPESPQRPTTLQGASEVSAQLATSWLQGTQNSSSQPLTTLHERTPSAPNIPLTITTPPLQHELLGETSQRQPPSSQQDDQMGGRFWPTQPPILASPHSNQTSGTERPPLRQQTWNSKGRQSMGPSSVVAPYGIFYGNFTDRRPMSAHSRHLSMGTEPLGDVSRSQFSDAIAPPRQLSAAPQIQAAPQRRVQAAHQRQFSSAPQRQFSVGTAPPFLDLQLPRRFQEQNSAQVSSQAPLPRAPVTPSHPSPMVGMSRHPACCPCCKWMACCRNVEPSPAPTARFIPEAHP